jgi:Mrp family chromosome partitioning ATPase
VLLQQYADVVVFDSPPVMAVADAAILASRLDGVLLVVDAGSTRRDAARHSKESLDSVGAHLLGVAINRLSASSGGYYYYSSEEEGRRKRRSPRDLLVRAFGRDRRSASTVDVLPAMPQEAAVPQDEILSIDQPGD